MNTDKVKDSKQLKISFNYKHGKVRVYRRLIETLGSPKYIQFLIKPEDKLLFIVGLEKREQDSFPVVLSKDSRHGGMVLNGQRFVRKMSEIGGWSLEGSYVIGGKVVEGMNMIEFDLTNVLNREIE